MINRPGIFPGLFLNRSGLTSKTLEMHESNWSEANIPDQKGKIIIITGANSGLGLEAAKALCKKNATVIMAVRDAEKGEQALQEIKRETPAADITVLQLDLADLDSVHSFAKIFHQKYSRLNILINNAGIMYPSKREVTKQGFEIQIGTNHLGHFALTGLLLDLLKSTPHARVVTQSSLAHLNANIRLNDLNWEKTYSRTQAYGQSKLANLLFTYELDRQFKANHIDAMATAAHPGITRTNLMRTSGFLVNLLTPLVAQKAEMGVLPILRAATDEHLTGGEYIGPNKLMGIRGYPEQVRSSKRSHDLQLAKDLWSLSEKMTGVHFNF